MWLQILVSLCGLLDAHAPPTYLPLAPVRVRGNTLIDARNVPFTLRGVRVPDLPFATASTFRVIQQRWNMNAVRLHASLSAWRADGPVYVEKLRETVAIANAEQLLVVLVLQDDAALPTEEAASFWRDCAALLRDRPGVIFDLYDEPRDADRDWVRWRAAMQTLVDTIRGTGAEQVIAAASFHDPLDFQGFAPQHQLRDANILYESHLYFDHALTDAERDANLGFLAGRFPIYVGAWGMPFDQAGPSCDAIPAEPAQAVELLLQTLVYFDLKAVSWTAADYRAGSLIRDVDEMPATSLDRPWSCGATDTVGMGDYLLLWLTGDPAGFGSIAADQIASVAGGPALPVAPGQLISIYGQLIGPETPVEGQLDGSGRMPVSLADVRVSFDGVDAPVTLAGYFQVNVQVPYAVREKAAVQLFYRGVPSNRITLAVVEAAPGLLPASGRFGEAAVTNENGQPNSSAQPAGQGSMITVLGTGFGETSPASVTGVAAVAPLAVPLLPVTLAIAGRPAEVLEVTAASGMIGVMQIRARVPSGLAVTSARTSIVVTAGTRSSRPEVTMWVR